MRQGEKRKELSRFVLERQEEWRKSTTNDCDTVQSWGKAGRKMDWKGKRMRMEKGRSSRKGARKGGKTTTQKAQRKNLATLHSNSTCRQIQSLPDASLYHHSFFLNITLSSSFKSCNVPSFLMLFLSLFLSPFSLSLLIVVHMNRHHYWLRYHHHPLLLPPLFHRVSLHALTQLVHKRNSRKIKSIQVLCV